MEWKPVPGEFPAQRPVTRSFDVFFDLRLNKWLSKQSWYWWFASPSRPSWRHCNALHLELGDAHMHQWGDGVIIGADIDLLPIGRQTITWENADFSPIIPMGPNLSVSWIKYQSTKYLRTSTWKWHQHTQMIIPDSVKQHGWMWNMDHIKRLRWIH